MTKETQWVDFSKKKPKNDCLCYVMNEKGFMEPVIAIYDARWKVFKHYVGNKAYLLDVTHWFELPPHWVI